MHDIYKDLQFRLQANFKQRFKIQELEPQAGPCALAVSYVFEVLKVRKKSVLKDDVNLSGKRFQR